MSSKSRARPQRPSVRPRLEELESRIVPAIFEVSSLGSPVSPEQTADRNPDPNTLLGAIHLADSNADASNTITPARTGAPAGTVGIVDIVVHTPHGTSSIRAADHFTYVPAPLLTGQLAAYQVESLFTTGTSAVIASAKAVTSWRPLPVCQHPA